MSVATIQNAPELVSAAGTRLGEDAGYEDIAFSFGSSQSFLAT